jgi:5'-nucleotidase / UDP-sugar diphosphatase
MVQGNHEFDYGVSVLASFIGNLSAPAISCNIEASEEPLLAGKVQRFVVKTLPKSGIKVGIIGFTPEDTATISSPGPNVKFLTVASTAAKCIEDAKAAGAQMILGVTHIGYANDLKLARDFRDFDAIVGGHSHSFLHGGAPPALLTSPATNETALVEGAYPTLVENSGKSIPVATAYWGSRYLGKVDMSFAVGGGILATPSGNNPILLGGSNSTNAVPDNSTVTTQILQLRVPLDEFINSVVGSSSVLLDGERGRIRNEETNLGNLVCDSMIWFVQNKTSILQSNPSIPFLAHYNGGGIRVSITAGEITRNQVVTVLPFGNTLIIKRVKASSLLEAFKNGVSGWTGDNNAAGKFFQVGGAKYSFDPRKNATDRIVRVVLTNRTGGEFDLTSYSGDVIVLMNDFIARGGDGYVSFASEPIIVDTTVTVDEVVSEYIRTFSPVAPKLTGRITNCETNSSAPLCTFPSPPPPPSSLPPPSPSPLNPSTNPPPPSISPRPTCSNFVGVYRFKSELCSNKYLAAPVNCKDNVVRLFDYRQAGPASFGRRDWNLNAAPNTFTNVRSAARDGCDAVILASNNQPTFGSKTSLWQYKLVSTESCSIISMLAKSGDGKGLYLGVKSDCSGYEWKTSRTSSAAKWKAIKV